MEDPGRDLQPEGNRAATERRARPTLVAMSRPRALTVGATIAAGAVAALGASVAASGPGENVTDPTTQSVVASIVVTLGGIALVAAAVTLLLVLRGRRAADKTDERPPTSNWMQLLGVVIALSLLAIILTLIALSRRQGGTFLAIRAATATPAARHLPPAVAFNRAASGGTIVVLVIVAALVFLPRLLRRLRRGRRPDFAVRAVEDADAPSAQGAHDASLALHLGLTDEELSDPRREPEPGASIVLAYQRFVALMAASSAPRVDWETPLEYSERLASGPFHDEPGAQRATDRLTALFNCARYGVMRMTESDRSEAIGALDLLEGAGVPS